MSMQDPIADMLTRIRNAQQVGDRHVKMPASKAKAAVLSVLQKEGFIEGFDEQSENGKKDLNVTLRYYQGRPVIEKITRISKLGLRIYRGFKEIPVVRAGMGIAIVSTSQGVMSGNEAVAKKLGGEILCTVE